MPRGYRLFVVAALGWLTLAVAPAPNKRVEPEQPKTSTKIERSLEAIAGAQAQAVENAKPGEYEAPCRDGEYNNRSDLCAQWYAARAARDAADWSRWALWVGAGSLALSAFGLYVVLQSLRQTDTSLAEARRANRITLLNERRSRRESAAATAGTAASLAVSERNAEAASRAATAMEHRNQLAELSRRPWVGAYTANYDLVEDGATLIVEFVNSGTVPALVTLYNVLICRPSDDPERVAFQAGDAQSEEVAKSLVLPNGKIHTRQIAQFNKDVLAFIKDGTWILWVQTLASYTNAETGAQYSTRLCYFYKSSTGEFATTNKFNDAT